MGNIINKPLLVLTIGISASGKTSWTEDFICNRDDWVNINRDNGRAEICGGVLDWTKYKFLRANEGKVSDVCKYKASIASNARLNVIVSDTNLSGKTRRKWYNWARENDYNVIVKEFPTSFEEAVKRDKFRGNSIGEGVIWKQWMSWLKYINYDFYIPKLNKPKAVIIDIDGTVATVNGRSHYDYDNVDTDLPRKKIISVVLGLVEEGVTPIFLSGRDGRCKDKTYKWIMDNIMECYLEPNGGFHLFMRPKGDSRRDDIIKKELFDKYIRNNFNVVAAIDDRFRLLRLWEQLGIPNIVNVNGSLYNEY